MKWFLSVLKDNYANFDGRARRQEYWMFTLVHTVICLILSAITIIGLTISESTQSSVMLLLSCALTILYSLYTLIPNLAVTIRRLHDVGKSGLWLLPTLIPYVGSLFSIYLLVLYCSDGVRMDNEYGADPKELSKAVLV